MLCLLLQRLEFGSEVSLLESSRPIPKDSKLFKCAPFLDENGVLCVRGRIQLSSLA